MVELHLLKLLLIGKTMAVLYPTAKEFYREKLEKFSILLLKEARKNRI